MNVEDLKARLRVLLHQRDMIPVQKIFSAASGICMYAGGGDFTTNIDGAGGEGTAQFASDAIEIYCG